MAKVLRRLLWVVVGAVGMFAAALLAVVVFVDPNDFKDDITQAVQQATGRELLLTGEIELSLFPWLGLTLGEAQLSNASGFDEATFARVESVDIKAKLLPLLQQRIEMKTVHLHGLKVNLSRSAEGRNNWDDLAGSTAKSPAHNQAAAKDNEASVPSAVALAIGGLNIEGAEMNWDDRQSGQKITVEDFDLQTGPIAPNMPIDISLSTQVSVSEPALKTPIKLQVQLTADTQAQRYRLNGLDLSLNLYGDTLPVSPLNIHLSANVDADMAQQELQLDDLKLQAMNLTANAKLSLQKILMAPTAKGQLSLAAFSPRELLKALDIALPKTADANVFYKAELNVAFVGSADELSVEKLDLLLDDSKITGSVKVKGFDALEVRYDLLLDAIDADRYLPPEAAPVAAVSPTSGAAVASTVLPLDMLRSLNLKGDLRAGEFKIANIRSSNLRLGLTAKSGQIRLSPVIADLYQGKYSGDIRLDVRKDTPKLAANEKLDAVHLGPLLKDMLGDDKVSGTVTLVAKVTAQGLTPEAITKSANGTANFSLRDGAVKGVNLGQKIREAYAKIKKKPAPPKATNATDFAAVTGSVIIRNGIIHNQDLQAKSPLLRVAGKGQVNLPKQRINYLLNTSVVETDQGQAGKELTELKSLMIPIKITGTFDKPNVFLRLGPVLKAKAKAELKRQKSKLKKKAKKKLNKKKDKLKKRLEDKLKEKFKGLF